ncbi:MAG: DUF4270 family protein [Pedobacter sp.]|nr:MAG: DUF4270 family protein [Pedobacter sp.]
MRQAETVAEDVTVTSRTVAEEPGQSFVLAGYPLGYMTDPTFGTSESSLAMTVSLPSQAAYTFGSNPVVDSAVLVLPYTTGFYGDSTSTYSIDVRQLKSDLSDEAPTSFKTNKSFAYNSATPGYTDGVFGNYTGVLKPNTPLKVTTIVTGKPDTLIAAVAQLRIKLDKAFIQNNIANLSAATLINNATFYNTFKGLHVSINKAKSNGKGGVAFFNFSGASSNLEVYYKRQNATTATNIDTVLASFPILSSTSAPVAATVNHNYTGTDIAKQLSTPTTQYQTTYLQGLAGLRNKISFPYLAGFIKNLGGKVVVNRAELVVDVSSGTDVAPFSPAPRIALYTTDLGTRRVNVLDNLTKLSNGLDNSRVATNFGGYYDPTNKNYTFIVTAMIQDLLDGKTVDYGTYIGLSSPTASAATYLLPPVTSAERSVIGSFGNATNKLKLNIYYTKIN